MYCTCAEPQTLPNSRAYKNLKSFNYFKSPCAVLESDLKLLSCLAFFQHFSFGRESRSNLVLELQTLLGLNSQSKPPPRQNEMKMGLIPKHKTYEGNGQHCPIQPRLGGSCSTTQHAFLIWS